MNTSTPDTLIAKLQALKAGGALLKRIPRQNRNIVIDDCIALIISYCNDPATVESVALNIDNERHFSPITLEVFRCTGHYYTDAMDRAKASIVAFVGKDGV